MSNYILDESGEPVLEPDLLRFSRWWEAADRRLFDDLVGDERVSTVFLGMDHGFGKGPPVLWETMVFGGQHDGFQQRYSSKASAMAGHAEALAMVCSATTTA